MPSDQRQQSRRKILKTTGVGLAGLVGASGVASAAPETETGGVSGRGLGHPDSWTETEPEPDVVGTFIGRINSSESYRNVRCALRSLSVYGAHVRPHSVRTYESESGDQTVTSAGIEVSAGDEWESAEGTVTDVPGTDELKVHVVLEGADQQTVVTDYKFLSPSEEQDGAYVTTIEKQDQAAASGGDA